MADQVAGHVKGMLLGIGQIVLSADLKDHDGFSSYQQRHGVCDRASRFSTVFPSHHNVLSPKVAAAWRGYENRATAEHDQIRRTSCAIDASIIQRCATSYDQVYGSRHARHCVRG